MNPNSTAVEPRATLYGTEESTQIRTGAPVREEA